MEKNLRKQILDFNFPRLPEMTQLKYTRMAENAFRFFRGTCHLFYDRLCKMKGIPTSPLVWICGDLHIENFGSYRGENGLIYFDLNDFDEGVLAPAIFEIIRLVTSIFVAFEVYEIAEDQAANLVSIFLGSYSSVLAKGKAVAIDPRTARGIVSNFLKHSERRSYKQLLGKRTVSKGKKILLSLEHEKHAKVEKKLKSALIAHISNWLETSPASPYNYKVKDVVFRIAGTGSLGVKRYLFLLRSTTVKGRYLLLDMKQSFDSSLSPFVETKPRWDTQAERIVSIQQRMQYVSSALLDVTEFEGESYVLGEMQPMEDTFDFSLVAGNYRSLIQVIEDMGALTASSQLRSGGMEGSANIDELRKFGLDFTSWKEQIVYMARELAKQNDNDYKEFLAGYEQGEYKNENSKLKANEKKEKVKL
ncbi:DUF2252 domain-containing protein [Pedobacter boryungensis]|uniref:DUF2252 family protein n=1 Tax=Pedobacter boryungensis TaxID=869962 RepID=A0ABX2DIM0_9SPHI|nr:DUF2252 family protein [Pedobacter boryungensis]NQX33141.1 DUF2252 family protein [Pedobacter boryungensis]